MFTIARRSALLVALLSASLATAQESRPAADAARLAQEFQAAYEAKDWPKAIELGTRLCDATKDPTAPYNLACVFALSGDKPNAYKWLNTAAERGFADTRQLMTDADLEGVRKSLEFLQAAQKVKTNADNAKKSMKGRIAARQPKVIVPPKHDPAKAAPVVIALHGFGMRADAMVEAWTTAAGDAGAVLVVPEAMNPQGSGFAWGSVDEAELTVEHCIEAAAKVGKIDAERIVLTGFSQGGFMTYQLSTVMGAKLRGALVVAGRWQPGPQLLHVKKLPKFVILVGKDDKMYEDQKTAASELRKAGASVLLKEFDGLGHEFPKERDAELKRALAELL